jgi:hypothetical protein
MDYVAIGKQFLEKKDELSSIISKFSETLDIQALQKCEKSIIENQIKFFLCNTLKIEFEEDEPNSVEILYSIDFLSKILKNFSKFMPIFFPLILGYIKNFEDLDSFETSIGVLGSISRDLQDKFYPYVKDAMEIFLLHLKNNLLPVSSYGLILEFFADVALSIRGKFSPYLKEVLLIYKYAYETKIKEIKSSSKIICLKESILEGYIGIIQGSRHSTNFESFKNYIPGLVTFIVQSYFDKHGSENLKKFCIGIIGDLGQTFKSNVKNSFDTLAIKSIINNELKSSNVERKKTALWTKDILSKI